MTTKQKKIMYWVLTIPIAAMMLMSAFASFSQSPEMMAGLNHLGYPLYFAKILGTAKFLGVLALLYPRFRTLTEWAYAGFTFTYLGAAFSHYSAGDPPKNVLIPLVLLAILLGARHFWKMTRPV